MTMEHKLIHELSRSINLPGFQKKGLTWITSKGDLQHLINFQISKFSDESDQSFTINIGVFSADAYRLCWAKEPKKSVGETDCILRKRISFFIGQETDKWWTLKTSQDISEVSAAIQAIIDEKVLPFLFSLKTFKELSHFIQTDTNPSINNCLTKIQLACLYYLSSNPEEAKRLLLEVSTDNVWGENAINVLNRLGV